MQKHERVVTDKAFNFKYYFNSKSGLYARTDILDAAGQETGVLPFQASWPHLLDIGIMGHCEHAHTGACSAAGVQCYQSGGTLAEPNMTLDSYSSIIRQVAGRVNQVALGGRGDPDCHPDFEAILSCSRDHDIVPNYTTSGYRINQGKVELTKQYCGAVAVSWYKAPHTIDAVQAFVDAGVKTNIHFVLSAQSIDEAIFQLETGGFVRGVNAVIFLLHKPMGYGQQELVLTYDHPKLREFLALAESGGTPFKVGFDTCSFPAVLNLTHNISLESIDTCEAARFSAYVTPDLTMLPCSFEQHGFFGVSLREMSVDEAWNSIEFRRFRKLLSSSCPGCSERRACLGGCPVMPEIVVCERDEKRKGVL